MGRKLSDWEKNKTANGVESTDRELTDAGHFGNSRTDIAKPGETSDNFPEDGFRILDKGVTRTKVSLDAGSAYSEDE